MIPHKCNNKFHLIILASLFTLLIISLFILVRIRDNKVDVGENRIVNTSDVTGFYSEELFYKGINESNPYNVSGVRAAVLPHHLLASGFIAETLKSIPEETQTIILIGPNHSEEGGSDIITSKLSWNTPFGLLYSLDKLVDELVSSGVVIPEDAVMAKEHSIAAITSYIKYIIPEVNIVPIIVRQKVDIAKIEIISGIISKIMKENENTVIVSSVDFSHYLSSIEAIKKDEETLKAITSKNYDEIINYGNDHLDSPVSLVLLLKSLNKIGEYDLRVLSHSNSGILTKTNTTETTSYFSILFSAI